jgi:hypothetical protein
VQEADGVEAEVMFVREEWDLIIGVPHEHAAIRIERYTLDESDNDWDANSLNCIVDVRAGRFQGRLPLLFSTRCLAGFREEIANLDRDVAGKTELGSLEGEFELRLACDRLGHVKIDVEVTDDLAFGNRLAVSFRSDQTMFKPLLEQLEAIAVRFPIRSAKIR